MMTTAADLTRKKCTPCEGGGVSPLAPLEVAERLPAVPGWKPTPDAKRIVRSWRVQDFAAALDFIQRIGQLAEDEGHHPDLHLTGYRNLTVELSTHAVGGLTENDFILAAKIDQLPPPPLKS